MIRRALVSCIAVAGMLGVRPAAVRAEPACFDDPAPDRGFYQHRL